MNFVRGMMNAFASGAILGLGLVGCGFALGIVASVAILVVRLVWG